MRHKDHIHDLKIADVEVGGDIHRIILGGIKNPAEACAAVAREKIIHEYDALRRLMITYPYGNEDMCADLVFDSDKAEAAHGYVIMECMGYPYYSGSNTIATVAALLEYGMVPFTEGISTIALDSPGGIVNADYKIEDDLLEEVTVDGGATYVIEDGLTLDVPDYGRIEYALVWSGAYFVMIDADTLDIPVDASGVPAMKKAGRAILEAVKQSFTYEHQDFGRIDSPGFIHFTSGFTKTADRHYECTGATYGYPNTIFYCPTGTGTSAHMTLQHHRGNMEDDAMFANTSAAGNIFIGRARGTAQSGRYKALRTTISAKPYVLSSITMHIDFTNPLMKNFKSLEQIMR